VNDGHGVSNATNHPGIDDLLTTHQPRLRERQRIRVGERRGNEQVTIKDIDKQCVQSVQFGERTKRTKKRGVVSNPPS